MLPKASILSAELRVGAMTDSYRGSKKQKKQILKKCDCLILSRGSSLSVVCGFC